jgi:hypothetical protein
MTRPLPLLLILFAASDAVAQSASMSSSLTLAGDPFMPSPATNIARRCGYITHTSVSDNNPSPVGVYIPVITGTAGTAFTFAAWRPYSVISSASATLNLCAGYCAPSASNWTRFAHRWKFAFIISTDSDVTLRRQWDGITESNLKDVTHATGPTASAVDFVAMGYDTSISANWRICSGDGTNYSCADIPGAAVAVSTEYVGYIDYSVVGIITATLKSTTNGSTYTTYTTTKTTNLPTNSTPNGLLQSSVTTLAAAVVNLYHSSYGFCAN